MSFEINPSLTRIYNLLMFNASRYPDCKAVVCGQRRVTYFQLQGLVDQQARGLIASGIKHGDRVAYFGNSSLDFWVCFLATTSIGAVWLGLNPKYSKNELVYVLNDAQPSILISPEYVSNKNVIPFLDQLIDSTDSIKTKICLNYSDGWQSMQDVVDRGSDIDDAAVAVARDQVNGQDAALVVYTSGSTGKPKGAVLSQYGLTYGAIVQQEKFSVESLNIICAFPINHIACVGDVCMTSLAGAGCVVFHDQFSPELQAQAIANEAITVWAGVPTMLQICLVSPEFEALDMSGLELVVWGGAALSKNTIQMLKAKGLRLMAVYGMTETTVNTCRTSADTSIDVLAVSIGRPDEEFPARVMTESGAVAISGEIGELQFQGDFLFKEYFNNPSATSDSFTDDGWFKTGDLVAVQDDGNLNIVGRLKEMFKSGGYNIYPREIEIAIEELPEVAMAAVIGVPDDKYQEVGRAFVQFYADAAISGEKIKSALKNRLANYKIPKTFVVMEKLPLLPVGKIDKSLLRAMCR